MPGLVRLVVMSATLGGGLGERVRELMATVADEAAGGGGGGGGGGAGGPLSSVPLVVSEGRSFPVQTVYLGRPDAMERDSLERAAAEAVVLALEAGGGGGGGGGGDVLVFLPGVGEIRSVARILEVGRAGGGAGPGWAPPGPARTLILKPNPDPALDRAAAQRVLQGARSMAAMVTAAAAAEQRRQDAAAAASASAAAAAAAAAAEDEEEALAAALRAAGAEPLESADASEDESESYGGGAAAAAAAISPGGRPAAAPAPAAGAAFDLAWREQLLREGLVGALVAAAYPDRIAERKDRPNKRAAYTLASGQVAVLPTEDDPLAAWQYLAVADIGGSGPAAARRRDGGGGSSDVVRAAAGLSGAAIERYLKGMVQEREVVFWASGSKAVLGRRQRRLGRLVLEERAAPVSDEAALPALLQGFKELGGIRAVGLSRETEAWRQRVVWLRSAALGAAPSPSPSSSSSSPSGSSSSSSSPSPSSASSRLAALPDLSDAGLLASSRSWLGPHLAGVRTRADLLKLDWATILRSLVPWELRPLVDSEAPSHLLLPTGTRALVDYGRDPPTVSARMQEVFGLAETPRLAGGRVPLQLELLNPGGRTEAVTSDLASFWRNAYPEVLKAMRGRYPRHVWPEDPLEAEATRLTKRALAAQQAAKQQQQQDTRDPKDAKAGAAASQAGAGAGGKGGKAGKGGGGGKRR
ncbi:hypothetical protein GPECTOR_21g711 [Gonium pectorale]|uniref:ATP-dependent RNA helicase HrpB C-terminal domain-containing protein n=1 Tax=Gonium pectorale TaxID=33097 RepID=A0A150GIH7_GONPE|nr:hypothetical protein GPECTOR_21g711 [Gonium pectorale]|eukprot:KXZ49485.1 hypothetical protein GPECTOR_21g711 [Gonium pectorale]